MPLENACFLLLAFRPLHAWALRRQESIAVLIDGIRKTYSTRTARRNRGIRVVMPDEPKVVPIPKPPLPTRARAIASHGLLRDQIIVSIGPLVFAVDYAVRITELQGVPGDGSGRVLSISEAVKPRCLMRAARAMLVPKTDCRRRRDRSASSCLTGRRRRV